MIDNGEKYREKEDKIKNVVDLRLKRFKVSLRLYLNQGIYHSVSGNPLFLYLKKPMLLFFLYL